MIWPPSTWITFPVTYAASSLARNATKRAISSGRPITGLGGGALGVARLAHLRGDRRNRDDRAAAARMHPPEPGMHDVEGADQVDAYVAGELGRLEVPHARPLRLRAGGMRKNLDRADGVLRLLEGASDGGGVGDVRLQGDRAAAERLDLAGDRCGVVGARAENQRDVRPAGRQLDGDRATDAAARARDERRPRCELPSHRPPHPDAILMGILDFGILGVN
jgi:hypothetical protein